MCNVVYNVADCSDNVVHQCDRPALPQNRNLIHANEAFAEDDLADDRLQFEAIRRAG